MKRIYFTLGLTLLLTVFYFSLSFAGEVKTIKASDGQDVRYELTAQPDGKYVIKPMSHPDRFAGVKPEELSFTSVGEDANARAFKMLTDLLAKNAPEKKPECTEAAKGTGTSDACKDTAKKDELEGEKLTPRELTTRKAGQKDCLIDDKGDALEGEDRLKCLASKIDKNLATAEDGKAEGRARTAAETEAKRLLALLMKDDTISAQAKVDFLDPKINAYLDSSKAHLKARGKELLTLVQGEYTKDVAAGKNAENSAFIKYFNEIILAGSNDSSSDADKAKFNLALISQATANHARYEALHKIMQEKIILANSLAAGGNIQQARTVAAEVTALGKDFKASIKQVTIATNHTAKLLAKAPAGFTAEELRKGKNFNSLQASLTDIGNSDKAADQIITKLNSEITKHAAVVAKNPVAQRLGGRYGFSLVDAGNSEGTQAAGIASANSAAASASLTGNCTGTLPSAGYSTDFNDNLARLAHHARGCNDSGRFGGLGVPMSANGLFNPAGAVNMGALNGQAGLRLPVAQVRNGLTGLRSGAAEQNRLGQQ